jgi:hypothetical protein
VSGDLRQDYFTLSLLGATIVSPGRCKIIGAADGRKWDERAGYGLSGASLFGGGKKLSHFGIEIALWEEPSFTSEQWLNWSALELFLSVPPGTRPPSLGIAHPILADVGITVIVIEERSQWTQDETGLWTCQLKCIQYRAAQVSFATAGPGVPPTSGEIAAQARFDAATAQSSAYMASGAGGASL